MNFFAFVTKVASILTKPSLQEIKTFYLFLTIKTALKKSVLFYSLLQLLSCFKFLYLYLYVISIPTSKTEVAIFCLSPFYTFYN